MMKISAVRTLCGLTAAYSLRTYSGTSTSFAQTATLNGYFKIYDVVNHAGHAARGFESSSRELMNFSKVSGRVHTFKHSAGYPSGTALPNLIR